MIFELLALTSAIAAAGNSAPKPILGEVRPMLSAFQTELRPLSAKPVTTTPPLVTLLSGKVEASISWPDPKKPARAFEQIIESASFRSSMGGSASETTPKKKAEDVLCSVIVDNMPVSELLSQLTDQTKANLVLLEPTPKSITLRLQNVPLSEMLRHICVMTDLAFLKVGNTFALAPPVKLKAAYPREWSESYPEDTVKQEEPNPIETRTLSLKYLEAASLSTTLKGMFPEGSELTVVAGPLSLTPGLASQDTSQGTGVASGVMTSDGNGPPSRTLVIRGPRKTLNDVAAAVAALDVPRPQVIVQVTIHDISNDALRDLGITWNFGGFNLSESQGSGIQFGAFTRSPLSFAGTINALEKIDKARLLASPQVRMLDGERAFVLIGTRLNFPVVIGYTQANTPIFDRREERVGIYLQVAANVSGDGTVTLSLYPQVSTVLSFLNINQGSYPQIATREAQTTLRVKDGETIFMGGLLKDEEISQMEKVPLLSEIPILGELFKRRRTTKNTSQVIITITPVIIPVTEG